MNFVRLIVKNLKIIFRNKFTAFVLLFGPLLIIAISGLAFNNSLSYNIKLGVYSANLSELGNSFTNDLEENFALTWFANEDSCVDSVKSKGYHGCLVIPEGLRIEEGKENILDFYFDNTRVNIVSSIKQEIFKSLDKTSSDISVGFTSGLIDSIEVVEGEIVKNIAVVVSEQKKAADSAVLVGDSSSLSSASNLDFDSDSSSLGAVTGNSAQLGADYSELHSIADKAINELDDFIDEAEGTNISSGVLSAIKDELSDLEGRLGNLTLTVTDVNKIIDSIDSLSGELDDLDSNLEVARSNKNKVITNLDLVSRNLDSIKAELIEVKSSFDLVLASTGKQGVRNASAISMPIVVSEQEIVTGSRLNYMFPNLLVLVIMFVTIITSATHVIHEKLDCARERMMLTPNPFFTNSVATFFTIVIIAFFQIILILATSYFLFSIDVLSVWLPLLIILLFAVVFFTLLGIVIGNMFNSEHTVMLGSIGVSSLFLIVSDMILPLESMPPKFIEVMNYTPFILSTDILRKVMFFGLSLSDIGIKFYYFMGYSFGLLLLIIIFSYIGGLMLKFRVKMNARKK